MYLLPQPQSLTKKEGIFTIDYNTKIIVDSSCSEDIFPYALLLREEIFHASGFMVSVSRCREINSEHVILLTSDSQAEKDAYHLSILPSSVLIKGYETSGILYGVQTLRQIIRQSGAVLPSLSINDAPATEHRGFYYDTSRGRVPRLDYLKSLADTLSYYKINEMQLYIEHSYLFSNLSEMWRDDTPLTSDDILELDRYCSVLGIDLIPSLASFGHLYKILCTNTHAHLCELEGSASENFSFHNRQAHHTLDVTNPDSLSFIKGLICEYMQLFRSRYFNICADETFDLGKGKSKKTADDMGVTKVYTEFVSHLSHYITECGRIPMFWSDIISQEPESYSLLPKELICLHWDYDPNAQDDRLKQLVNAGASSLYVCPGVHGWNHLINNQHNAYKNISAMCEYAYQYHAMGILTTDWGDFGHINHPDFSRIGCIYGASFSWNKNILPENEINRQISVVEYGDTTEELADLFQSFGNYEIFPWYFAVRIQETLKFAGTPEEALSFLENCNPQNVETGNKELEQLIQKLYNKLGSLPAYTKQVTGAYILAAHGQILLNKLLFVLDASLRRTVSLPDRESAFRLASDLERWLTDYRKLWLTVSKESEFYRIADVFYWYADFLRTLDMK